MQYQGKNIRFVCLSRIFYRKIIDCARIYQVLYRAPGASDHTASPSTADSKVLDMCHGEYLTSDQDWLLQHFTQVSSMRCTWTTNAYVLGVQIKDIRYVIHRGPTQGLLGYWQNRWAGWKGWKAVMFLFPGCHPYNKVNTDMMVLCVSSSCLRRYMLRYLHVQMIGEWKNVPTT